VNPAGAGPARGSSLAFGHFIFLPLGSQTGLLAFLPRGSPDLRDFHRFILKELNQHELAGRASSSCSHPEKLSAVDRGQAFLPTPRPVRPGAAGITEGLAPKPALTGGLPTPACRRPPAHPLPAWGMLSRAPSRLRRQQLASRRPWGDAPRPSTPSRSGGTARGEGAAGCPPGWGVWVPTRSPGVVEVAGPIRTSPRVAEATWTRRCRGVGGDDGEWEQGLAAPLRRVGCSVPPPTRGQHRGARAPHSL